MQMIPPQNVTVRAYAEHLRRLRRQGHTCEDVGRAGTDLVLLSCKRPVETYRLMESLAKNRIALAGLVDSWSVDNGSGQGVRLSILESKVFKNKVWFPRNIGMGAAVNDVLGRVKSKYVLFIEDDLVLDYTAPFVLDCERIFEEFPQVGIIKLKRKTNWNDYPYRRIGPMQEMNWGTRFHPWLPSPRWTFRWGQRPWYPVGIHNVWSLGPVMFRHVLWRQAGPIPSGQGRGQALAAEEQYALRVNTKWIAARPVGIQPFLQPPTIESPGFKDDI